MEVVLLRQRPELKQQTAELLNMEWPRSLAARYHYYINTQGRYTIHTVFCRLLSLEEGKDDLPCSLILVRYCQQSGETQVMGHVRLAAAAVRPRAVLLEACELATVVAQPYCCLSLQSMCVLQCWLAESYVARAMAAGS